MMGVVARMRMAGSSTREKRIDKILLGSFCNLEPALLPAGSVPHAFSRVGAGEATFSSRVWDRSSREADDQLRSHVPLLPPDLRTSCSDSMLMPFSALLHMS